MAPKRQTAPQIQLFKGVVYHIRISTDDREVLRIRGLLESNGATEATLPQRATRIITDSAHFASFKEPQFIGAIVSPQWVYKSLEAGVKQPSHFYSTNPTMIFSSIVISAIGVSASMADYIHDQTIKYGGQWLPTLTSNVTHLIIENNDFDLLGFTPTIVPVRWFSDSLARQSLQTPSFYGFTRNAPESQSHPVASKSCESLVRIIASTNAANDQHPLLIGGPLPFVPFEILAKIFLALRDLVLDKSFPSIEKFLTVSQVCGRWRDVAHCTAALWTHLHLDFHSKRRYNHIHNVVKEWIARSGAMALTVAVRSCYPRSHNPVIDFILSHASRIRELSLDLPAPHFPRLLAAAPGRFPVLETVKLTNISQSEALYEPDSGESRDEYFGWKLGSGFAGESDSGILWASTPITVFGQAPRLTSVTIHTEFSNIQPRTFLLPWANLTELDLSFTIIDVRDTAHILPLCIAMVGLKFATDRSQGVTMPEISILTLSKLQTLEWSGFNVDDGSIFRPLILPRLITLNMREGEEDTVFSLHTRSAFALQDLTLTFFCLSFPRFSLFLRDMPSLTSLWLSVSIVITDELLEFLVYDPRNPVLPRLAQLTLFDHDHHFSEITMLRMVASRWRRTASPTPLTKISISNNRNTGHDLPPAFHRRILDKIAEMVEDGLEFKYDLK
ncbi:hypothetical protein C8R43DRAFT_1245307 [Mycena crocata]|nr:hypothetical protein C8R43DRAFT_1245307 [Mycena crocata]